VNSQDNVAVAKQPISDGQLVSLPDETEIIIIGAVTPGHRFATKEIPVGQFVRQYAQPIGTSRGIARGEAVTPANMSSEVPVVRDIDEDQAVAAADYFETAQLPTFLGFRRPDGRIGTRNFVLIAPTSMCASHEALQISMLAEFQHFSSAKYPNVDGVTAIPHNKGCGCQSGENLTVLMRTLANYAAHPNVGGVVMLDLGCEKTNLHIMEKFLIERTNALQKPLVRIGIQESGGTADTITRGLKAVEDMLPLVNACKREPFPVSELVLGVKCGSSDGLSGLSANPSLGYAADLLVRSHGTVLMTEVPEFCGAEHVLANRAKDAETARQVYEMVDWYKDYAATAGAVLNENPSPGNVAGGLLNITIKSLGAIAKGGTTRVEGVTDYAEPAAGRGLQLMQGPGYDQESTPGLVAAGATVVVFTTGNGTTIGNAIAPVIKLSSNDKTFNRMKSDIDLSAGGVITGAETIEECGARIFEHVRQVASGEIPALAEKHKHREFQVWGERAIAL
jgi:altronate hydrolase